MALERLRLVALPDIAPQWREALQEVGFAEKELAQATYLMEEVGRGIAFVRQQFLTSKEPLTRTPSVYFTSGTDQPNVEPSPTHYDPELNTILVDIDHLRRAARMDALDEVSEKDPATGEVLFQGMLKDKYYLSGVHETDHARYFQHHPQPEAHHRIHPTEVTVAAYDAQPHELSAQRTELLAAEKKKLEEATKQVIRTRVELAVLFDHEMHKQKELATSIDWSWYRYWSLNVMRPRGERYAEQRHDNRIAYVRSLNKGQLVLLLEYAKKYEQKLQEKKIGNPRKIGPKVQRVQAMVRFLQKALEDESQS